MLLHASFAHVWFVRRYECKQVCSQFCTLHAFSKLYPVSHSLHDTNLEFMHSILEFHYAAACVPPSTCDAIPLGTHACAKSIHAACIFLKTKLFPGCRSRSCIFQSIVVSNPKSPPLLWGGDISESRSFLIHDAKSYQSSQYASSTNSIHDRENAIFMHRRRP